MHHQILPMCFILILIPSPVISSEGREVSHLNSAYTYTNEQIKASWLRCRTILRKMGRHYRLNPDYLKDIHRERQKCFKEHKRITPDQCFTFNKLERLEDIVQNFRCIFYISRSGTCACRNSCFLLNTQ